MARQRNRERGVIRPACPGREEFHPCPAHPLHRTYTGRELRRAFVCEGDLSILVEILSPSCACGEDSFWLKAAAACGGPREEGDGRTACNRRNTTAQCKGAEPHAREPTRNLDCPVRRRSRGGFPHEETSRRSKSPHKAHIERCLRYLSVGFSVQDLNVEI